jgi:radical SAM protein with 4Fe4S-binding SPASM domain
MADYSAPLRVSWELPSAADKVALHWQRLQEGRVLFVEAFAKPKVPGQLGQPDQITSLCALVAEAEARPGPRLTLVADAEGLGALVGCAAPGFLSTLEGVLLPPYPDAVEIAKLLVSFRVFTLGLWSTAEGLSHFAEALRLVEGAANIGISVMNPTVDERDAVPALTEEDRQRALQAWAARATPERVHIHDLFLSETLGLEPFKNYGGCAAGAGLAHLKADGTLVACRTLPLYLGDLNTTPLTDIWGGPQRSETRRGIEAIPHGCGGCELVEVCRGGCPGLAKSLDEADLSCIRAKH